MGTGGGIVVNGNGAQTSLIFDQTSINGPIIGGTSTTSGTILTQAIDTSFSSLVTVQDYGTIHNCSFNTSNGSGGLMLTTNSPGMNRNEPEGIVDTYFNGSTTVSAPNAGTNSNTFELDTYTNYWIKRIAPPANQPPANQKTIVYDPAA